jgi:hypothetical protein
VHVDAGVHAFVLEHADHFEPGTIAHVGETAVGVTAEGPLIDATVGRAIEQGAPRLQLANAVRRFLRVDLRHAPVVVHLAAAHRVAEMHAPVVLGHDIAERRGRPALGHDGVCFAEQRFADQRDLGILGARFDGRAQSRAARTDHDDVVVVAADVGHYSTVLGFVPRALKRRLGDFARPEGRTFLERPSGRAPWPSRDFSPRIMSPRVIYRILISWMTPMAHRRM